MRAAQERAIPEAGDEIYKSKAQQTKLMERMLIEIHEERRKQYRLQQVEKFQLEEIERHEDYNPLAETEEQDRKKIQKKEFGDAMNDLERALPRYC